MGDGEAADYSIDAVESLDMSAQEWKWYLEDQGLAPSNEKAETPPLDAPSISETQHRDLLFLPRDAAIRKVMSDGSSAGILERLSVLHTCMTQDLSTLKYLVREATSQADATLAKVDLFKTRREQAKSDWEGLCDMLGIPSNIVVETDDLAKSVDAWVETELRPSCMGLVHNVITKSAVLELKPVILYHDRFFEDRNIKAPANLPLLSKITNAEALTEISDFADFRTLMLELEALEAFLKGRRFDNASVAKGKTLPFMVQGTPDSPEQLDQQICTVNSLLDELRSNDSLSKWVLWEGKCREQSVANLKISRSRMSDAKRQVKQAEDQLSPIRTKASRLADDLEWCQTLVADFRKSIEQDIGSLLKRDEPISIHMEI